MITKKFKIHPLGVSDPKRKVFKHFLKPSVGGRLFQIFDPTTLKEPTLAKLVLHLVDGRLALVEDLRERLWVVDGSKSAR